MSKNPKKISLIGSRVTSVLSVALVLIIVGLCITLGFTVHRASDAVADGTTIMATVKPGVDFLRVSEMKREFNDAPWCSGYDFIPAKTVLSREVEGMDSLTREGIMLLGDNPYGDEFILHVRDGWRSSDSIATLTQRLNKMPGIDIVSNDAATMGQTNDSIHRVMFYLGLVGIVLLFISIVLIKNTISLSIYSRRFNIHTMKLVGATDSFIRRPFVRAGMVTGLIAGVAAVMVVCSIQCYLMFNDSIVGPWITTTDVVLTAIGLVVLGAVIARAAAWWSATNYLKKSYDSLFKQ